MKTSYIFGIALIFIVLVFVFASENFNQPEASAKNLSAASLSMQIATSTPPAEDRSEVGSTDGIVIMGFVLVIVVTVPILFRRKKNK
ncbi:MAG: hypothetical protein Q7T89_07225 [Anaerolineales bacterium]|nr:hypothetical protein [Anaerolineales bacterium]